MAWTGDILFERQGNDGMLYQFTDFDADAETTDQVRFNANIEIVPREIIWMISRTAGSTAVIDITFEVSLLNGSFTIVDRIQSALHLPLFRTIKLAGVTSIQITANVVGSGNTIDVYVMVKN